MIASFTRRPSGPFLNPWSRAVTDEELALYWLLATLCLFAWLALYLPKR
jgi:hypothetical protein